MDVEAVTIDALGTLVALRDPVPALRAALAARGLERDADEVRRAFDVEAAYYVPRSHDGRDATSLADLRARCTAVFLCELGAGLDDFPFTDCLAFELLPGARDALELLSPLKLCVVSNWDIGLHEHLARLGVDLPVVTSAEAGAPKPDPRIFVRALELVGARTAVHVGDSRADEEGAHAAGLRFEPAPLADAARRIVA